MKYKIRHETEYVFDSEVFLEPHYLRFRPRKTTFMDLKDFSLDIQPKPSGCRVMRDEENNMIDFCWFDGVTNNLLIKAESILETAPFNPFNFIIHPSKYNQLGFVYSEKEQKLLYATLEKQLIPDDLIKYGSEIKKASQNNTIQYLTLLTDQLHKDFKVEYREEGSPYTADETFQIKSGSCRDLSWMQIQLLRNDGFATRFVSGYFYFDMEEPIYELHAWVEVYLPGAGWLGLDPSHGILTGNTHFPIASSATYENTMPVSGGIRGSASSILNTQLSISILL